MRYPLPELLDRRSITLLKIERIPSEADRLKQELAQYDEAIREYGGSHKLVDDWARRLYEVNGMIWDQEAKIRQGQLEQITLEEVGRTAIKIREINGLRIKIKGDIASTTGSGFQDVKVNHASAERTLTKDGK